MGSPLVFNRWGSGRAHVLQCTGHSHSQALFSVPHSSPVFLQAFMSAALLCYRKRTRPACLPQQERGTHMGSARPLCPYSWLLTTPQGGLPRFCGNSVVSLRWGYSKTGPARRDSGPGPLRGLEGVPGLPGAPQDEAGLTRKFETSHVGGATPKI